MHSTLVCSHPEGMSVLCSKSTVPRCFKEHADAFTSYPALQKSMPDSFLSFFAHAHQPALVTQMSTQTSWDSLTMRAAALLPKLSEEDLCQVFQVGALWLVRLERLDLVHLLVCKGHSLNTPRPSRVSERHTKVMIASFDLQLDARHAQAFSTLSKNTVMR